MSETSEKTERHYILPLSLLAALIASFLVKTILIRIEYSLVTFFITFALLLILFYDAKSYRIQIKKRIETKIIYYILALVASVLVLTLSGSLTVYPTSIWNSFATMPLSSFLRMISTFFLTSIFPGMIIYNTLLRKYSMNIIEKLGLILLLSFCFSTISGLLLTSLQAFSSLTLIITLWTLVGLLEVYYQLRIKNIKPFEDKQIFTINTNLIALIIGGVAIIVLSYVQVLAVAPMNGIVSGDVLSYMVSASRFVDSKVFGLAPYVWSSYFYLENSILSGIPMHYVSAGLQFYQILLPSSFYFFVRTIFPEHKKVAVISTLLCFFVAGIGGWLLIGQMMGSANVFVDYAGTGTQKILQAIFQYTGGPGLTPLSLTVFAFDFGLVFYAIALAYRGLVKEKRALSDYFLPAFFAAVAFFTHSVNTVLVFLILILFNVFFSKFSKKYLVITLLLTIALVFLFDPISKLQTINGLLGLIVQGNVQVLNLPVILTAILTLGLFAFLAFFVSHNNKIQSSFRKFISFLIEVMSKKIVKIGLYLIGFLLFAIGVILYLLNFGELQYTAVWQQQAYIFPWYYIISRSYGVIFPFAVLSIPLLTKIKKVPFLFILSLTIAIISPAILSLIFPELLSPNIIYARYTGYLLFVLSIFAAMGLIYMLKTLQGKYYRILAVTGFVILISSSMLSQAYVRELYVIGGQGKIVSDAASQAINWLNENIKKDSTILPLSDFSERLLTNLGLGVRVLPNFQVWWLKDVLLKAMPEIVLYGLSEIGVDYLFVINGEFSSLENNKESFFESTVFSFPKVYQNSEVTILEVPDFPIYADSKLILVNPSTDAGQTNVMFPYSLLMAAENKFGIEYNVGLSTLKPENTYLFPKGVFPPVPTEKLLKQIEMGASVVSLDNNLVSQILNLTYTNESDIVIPTDTLEGWAIEVSTQGNLAKGKSDIAGSYVFAENAVTTSNGALIYNHTFEYPLNLDGVSIIKLWIKTNMAGNFYLSLFSDKNNYEVWYGKYDQKFKINSTRLGEWVQITLPTNQLSHVTPDFNSSNISYMRIGLDELSSSQPIEFYVGGLEAFDTISSINFSNGRSFPVSIQYSKTNVPHFGQLLASYTLNDGSEIPFIEFTQIGKGFLFFLNAESMAAFHEVADYKAIIGDAVGVLNNRLGFTNSVSQKWALPLFDDLFEEVSLARLEVALNSRRVIGGMIWHDNINILGNVKLTSDQILLASEQLNVEKLTVFDENTENLVFNNVNLLSAWFKGKGSLLTESSNVISALSDGGLYSTVKIDSANTLSLNLEITEATFQILVNGAKQYFSLNNANITLKLSSPPNSVLWSKQPVLEINGTLSSTAQGIVIHDGGWFGPNLEKTTISGNFRLDLSYSSNMIFSRMTIYRLLTSNIESS